MLPTSLPCAIEWHRKYSVDYSVHCSNHFFTTTRMASGRDDPVTRPWNAYLKPGGPAIGMLSMRISRVSSTAFHMMSLCEG